MLRVLEAWTSPAVRASWLVALASAVLLAGCSAISMGDLLPGSSFAPPQQSTSIGKGQVKVGLILPLSGSGNAAVARVDAQCRRAGARRIQQPGHSAAGEGRRRQCARRTAGRATVIRRGCRDHPWPAVCADGWSGRAGCRGARRPGYRVFDRLQRRGPRGLSLELPAGIRRRAHHRLCRRPRAAVVRCVDSGQRLRYRGRGRVQAGGRAPGRTRGRARALPARPRTDAGAGAQRGTGSDPGRCHLHSRRRRSCADDGADAGGERHRHQAGAARWGPACGRMRRSSPILSSKAAGMRDPIRPAFAISPAATAPATARIRCVPLRSPTMPSRWLPRW